MGKGSRPKSGKRTASGRLSRAGQRTPEALAAKIVQPSDWVKAMQDRYGVHYATALGRAYASGLLGGGTQAEDRYQAGKRFSRLQKRWFARKQRCALDQSPRGNVVEIEYEGDQADQEWLYHAGEKLAKTGLRSWLDELVSEEYVSFDPPWLTRLLMGGKDPYDHAMLAHCTRALDLIAPPRKELGILVA